VSITVTGTPGRRVCSPDEVLATTPAPPRVIATMAGPRPSQSSSTSSGVKPGISHCRSSWLTLTTSATVSSSCTPASTSAGFPIKAGRQFGS
jgi:hypothetical protein